MKRFLPVIVAAIAIAAAAAYPHFITPKNPDPDHIHADFAVWVDGQQSDYSGDAFMSTDTKELHPYMHLHDHSGHVLHSHKPGLKIGEFFNSLPWKGSGYHGNVFHVADSPVGDESYNVRLFVNGVVDPLGSDYVFHDGDHLLITDANDEGEVQRELSKMTNDACLYSKTCPWRGVPPTEKCISDPMVPCKL